MEKPDTGFLSRVPEVVASLFGRARAEHKRLAKGIPPDPAGSPLFGYRQLDSGR